MNRFGVLITESEGICLHCRIDSGNEIQVFFQTLADALDCLGVNTLDDVDGFALAEHYLFEQTD